MGGYALTEPRALSSTVKGMNRTEGVATDTAMRFRSVKPTFAVARGPPDDMIDVP